MNSTQPTNYSSRTVWTLDALIQGPDAIDRATRSCHRLLSLTSELEDHATMTVTWFGTSSAGTQITLESSGLATTDVTWLSSGAQTWITGQDGPTVDLADFDLFQIVPSLTRIYRGPAARSLDQPEGVDPSVSIWSQGVRSDGMPLLEALRADGAIYRVHVAPGSPIEHQMVQEQIAHTWQMRDPSSAATWAETSLRVRALLALPKGARCARSRAAVRGLGVGLDLVPVDESVRTESWVGERSSLLGSALPVGLAFLLTRLPAAPEQAGVIGLKVIARTPQPVPVPDAEAVSDGTDALRLGSAVDSAGDLVPVQISAESLTTHLQVIGASGTGKTTALAGLAVSAVEAGFGVTVLSPHPDLAARVAAEVHPDHVGRMVTISSGDPDAVVPVNALSGRDGRTMETFVSVLQEIIDPGHTGMFGLRAQRLISHGFEASQALLGDRASIVTAAAVFQDQRFVSRVAEAIRDTHPETARALTIEVANMSPTEYSDLMSWYQSRLHALIGSSLMRQTLGTGEDALDVTRLMDARGVLLVDLASLTIGVSSAQMLGELWLAKHWNALASRADRRPHLLIVDECHLFGSGLLPRLLAEGRKFGIGVVLAHQHLGQLTGSLRDAAQANAASVLAFRMAPQEALAAYARLGTWSGEALTRMPNLQAAATMSLPDRNLASFTLLVDHNERAVASPDQLAAVQERSHRLLVRPYSDRQPLGAADIDSALRKSGPGSRPDGARSFVDEMLAAGASRAGAAASSVSD